MKYSWIIASILFFIPISVSADELPCSKEYAKLNESSVMMASPDLKPETIEKVQKILDEWQPKYDACMSAYGEENGDNARAELEVKLATQTR